MARCGGGGGGGSRAPQGSFSFNHQELEREHGHLPTRAGIKGGLLSPSGGGGFSHCYHFSRVWEKHQQLLKSIKTPELSWKRGHRCFSPVLLLPTIVHAPRALRFSSRSQGGISRRKREVCGVLRLSSSELRRTDRECVSFVPSLVYSVGPTPVSRYHLKGRTHRGSTGTSHAFPEGC